jgi:uncharacterized coiled-coil protein SlyX
MAKPLMLGLALLLMAGTAAAQTPYSSLSKQPSQASPNPCVQGDDLDRLSCQLAQANTLAIHLQPQLRSLVGALTEMRSANTWWAECVAKPACVDWANGK